MRISTCRALLFASMNAAVNNSYWSDGKLYQASEDINSYSMRTRAIFAIKSIFLHGFQLCQQSHKLIKKIGGILITS